MESLRSLIGKRVELELSGCKPLLHGEFIDMGSDVLVLYSKSKYIYTPIHHLQHLRLYEELDNPPMDSSPDSKLDLANISYRKILMNSRGVFTEIYLGGSQSLHGYVTSIMNDYFVYHSPMHQTVYIPVNHVKYLIPYPPNTTPYSLDQKHFPVQPSVVALSRTMDQLLKKLEGQLVVFDLGEHPYKKGLLKSVDDKIVQLVLAGGNDNFLHLDHIKSIQLP